MAKYTDAILTLHYGAGTAGIGETQANTTPGDQRNRKQVDEMEQAPTIVTTAEALTTRIDDALRQFTARDLVAAAEVVDVLLDLRLILLSAEQPAEVAAN